MIDQTRIPTALAAKSEDFVVEPANQLATLLLSVRSRRGHDMGWVGVTLDSRSTLPSAKQLREQIEAFLDRMIKAQ